MTVEGSTNNHNQPHFHEMAPGNKGSESVSLWLYAKRNQRFLTLVVGIMFFFACHNYLQEYIMHLPGFDVGVFLGYLEVLGVTVCAAAERTYVGETERKSPRRRPQHFRARQWASWASAWVRLRPFVWRWNVDVES